MGIRETLNQKKGAATAIAIGFLAAALGLIIWQVTATGQASGPPQLYFSADDGQTYFKADATNVPPFDHGGKQAVRAYVFKCGGKRFVGYLERYNADAHKAVLARQGKQSAPAAAPPAQPEGPGALREGKARADYGTFYGADVYGREVKRPGDKDWVPSSDFSKSAKVTNVKCPDGGGTAEPVTP
jgi:hypothetical protein